MALRVGSSTTTVTCLGIRIRTEDGVIPISCDGDDTILDLKHRLQEKGGYPIDEQEFFLSSSPGPIEDREPVRNFHRTTLNFHRKTVAPLAATTDSSQFTQPNGSNPFVVTVNNHIPGLDSLTSLVKVLSDQVRLREIQDTDTSVKRRQPYISASEDTDEDSRANAASSNMTGPGKGQDSGTSMRKRRTYKSVFENVDDSDGRPTAKPEDSPACQRLANHSLPTTPRQSANVSPIAPSPQTDCLPSPVTASTSLRSKALDFFLAQSTLWALVVIFTAANGSMVGLGATQSRANECVPDASSLLKNDGFWALLGQLFVSLLSLYCTLVPILRHRARTIAVQQFWFYLMIGLSAAASIAALIVYGYSWQASLVLSNVAGLSALVPAAQLAGGIKGD